MADDELTVRYNDKVKLTDGGQGSVKYIGEVIGKNGVFYGVDLVKGSGKNNGTMKKVVYFKTRGNKKSGKFVRKSAFKKATKTEHSVPFTVGDAVNVKSKGNGIVRFVGIPAFSKVPKPMYGVELDDPKGICDGTIKGFTYFTCTRKFGVYVEQNKVAAGKSKQSGKGKRGPSDVDDVKEDKPKKKKKGKKDGKKKKKKVKTPVPEPEPVYEEPEPEPEPEPEQEPEAVPEPESEPEIEPEPEVEEEEEEPMADEEPEAEVEAEQDEQDDNKDDEDVDITEDVVIEFLKENYKVSGSNIISPHVIAKKMMVSQGVPETQFQFHLNQLGKVTYWIVNSITSAFGDVEVPGEGFKLIQI